MFSSLKNKPFLKKAAFLTLALFLSVGLLFISCQDNTNSSGSLNATWDDGWSPVTINTSAKTIVYTGNYEAIIENSPDYTATSGVLIIKFTKYATNYDGNPVATHVNVGKYSALYWTELTASSVRLADAYDKTPPPYGSHAIRASLSIAQTDFLPAADKVGNYVDWSITAPYTKK
jgi:hypothetical protein